MIAMLSIGITCLLIWITVAGRLLWVAARTRKAPELAMGAYFGLLALAFMLGIPMLQLRDAGEIESAARLSNLTLLCFAFAALSLALGTWRMFRPQSRWAGVACVVLMAEMLAAWWVTASTGQIVSLSTPTASNLAFGLGRVTIYMWAFGESFHCYTQMRKRVVLGLADPMLTQQILLWGVAALLMGMSAIVIITHAQLTGIEPDRLTVASVISILFSLSATFSIWCAFFPPRLYRRWIEKKAASTD